MNHALLRLIWLESRAIARLAVRRMATRRGLAMVAAGLVLATGVPYAAFLSVTRGGNFAATIAFMHVWAPEAFFLFVLLGAIAPRGLYYRPAELALLFPAPVSRRDLVLYNMLWRARMSLLSALWLTFVAVLGGAPLSVALPGYALVLLLLQASSQWFAVLRARLAERHTLKIMLAVTGAAVVATAWARGSLIELLSTLAWLTRPALEAVSSRTFGNAAPWAFIVAATIAALVGATCLMDGSFHEAAAARAFERRRKRSVRGGVGSYGPSVRTAAFRVPQLPYLSGAGPVAWRQTIELVRNPRRIAVVLAVVAASAVGAIVVVHLEAAKDFTFMSQTMRVWTVAAVLCIGPLLSGDSLGFDFRRDLDRIATLKALPISPVALCAGQLAPATLFVTCVQTLGLSVIAATTETMTLADVIACIGIVAPMNWTAIAVENTLFLLSPYRTVVDDPGDMTFAGRLALATTLKMAALCGLGVLCAFLSALMLLATRGSIVFTVSALVSLLVLACVPATRLAGWAFQRFDVARDVPA